MGTSDGILAAQIVDALAVCGVPFAILHSGDEVARGSVTSDVDIAIGLPISDFGRELIGILRDQDVHLVLRWAYDAVGTSLFFMAPTGGGAQLDMAFDPDGLGRYSVMTSRIIERSVEFGRWRVSHPDDRVAYQSIKSCVKAGRRIPTNLFESVVVRRDTPLGLRARRTRLILANRASRITAPIGAVVRITRIGDSELDAVAEPFRKTFPHVLVRSALDYRTLAHLPVFRRRPSLVVHGGRPSLADDIVIGPQGTTAEIVAELVTRLSARALDRWSISGPSTVRDTP